MVKNVSIKNTPYDRLAHASRDLFSLACDKFSINILNLPSGRHSRFQSLSRACPDTSTYTLTHVPTVPVLSIMTIFERNRSLIVPANAPAPPRPG